MTSREPPRHLGKYSGQIDSLNIYRSPSDASMSSRRASTIEALLLLHEHLDSDLANITLLIRPFGSAAI
jgi:hypothetical protein